MNIICFDQKFHQELLLVYCYFWALTYSQSPKMASYCIENSHNHFRCPDWVWDGKPGPGCSSRARPVGRLGRARARRCWPPRRERWSRCHRPSDPLPRRTASATACPAGPAGCSCKIKWIIVRHQKDPSAWCLVTIAHFNIRTKTLLLGVNKN